MLYKIEIDLLDSIYESLQKELDLARKYADRNIYDQGKVDGINRCVSIVVDKRMKLKWESILDDTTSRHTRES